ncbi:endolytic transglycosylase MltG [Methylocystis parvus]|uniref:Endolytic murein transglycosylase n=2 Tax=Methylocystis parvus TaxID=134 RepID=A0A6B8M3M9_9HYPH|nr:endolytic transglycosylase MltG [Methylocystis parvus]
MSDETGDKGAAPGEEGKPQTAPEAAAAAPDKLNEAPAESPKTEPVAEGAPEPAKSAERAADVETTATAPADIQAKPAEPPMAAQARAPDIVVEAKAPEQAREEAGGGSFFRRRAALPAGKQTLQPEAPPAPPPKKKKRREGTLSAMSGFLSFLLVSLVAGVFGVIATLHKLKEPGPLAADKIVYLPPRSDLPEMVAQLEREGVIDSPGLLNFALLVEGARSKLKPGEYLFKKKASLREVIDELVAGKQLMHSLTIPEGLTSEQIAQRLRETDLLAGDILETPKEGALLPETYKFPRGFPRAKLISKMQDDQRKIVEQIWAKRARDLPLKSPWDLVTLASIVEKETGKSEERPRVAAVFMNRLRKGMRLQSDPTIVYGLVGGKATLGHGILRSEIEKWTPYNTYAIDGLPPGPIANPGRAALEATASPANTRDLYFVADGAGGHIFAESLDQHSRNVQNWRKIEQDRKAAPPAGIDQTIPAAVPPAAPKSDKRTEAPLGRLVTLDGHDDYSVGRVMAPDEGATHRLGKFSPAGAAFFLGGHEDPTADAASHLSKLRVARPYFTEDPAQPKSPTAHFSEELLASAGPGPLSGADGEEGAIGPDMMARESADGKALPDGMADIAAYPVSPARRAEQKARAARLGLSAGSDELPTDAVGARVAPEEAAAAVSAETPIALAPTAPQRARPRAFDASEGTSLDPLRDRSWDLTSAKTVPSAANLR